MNAALLFQKNTAALRARNALLADLLITADEQESCYAEPARVKTGSMSARFKSGKTMFSTYNPERDAEIFASACEDHRNGFFTVTGLGSAHHVSTAITSCEKAYFLVIEKNAASVKTLFTQFDFTQLLENTRFMLCVPQQLEIMLPELYLPALFSGFFLEPQQVWAQENTAEQHIVRERLKQILETISADFSVQAHFGKIWMRNILRNLRIASLVPKTEFTFPLQKKAAVIAAGSTLDSSIGDLLADRDNLYLISTDTSLQALAAYGLTADAVISIDGQNISYLHFLNGIDKNTLLAADLCAHPKAAELALKKNAPILFFQGSHPLCLLADCFQREKTGDGGFLKLDCSSGTVTAAAIDFAVKAGFTDIELHGADFLYLQKPYARGTYLDALYAARSSRFEPLEQQFSALMFRTETKREHGGYASPTLSSYAKAIRFYAGKAVKNGISIRRAIDRGYPLELPACSGKTAHVKNRSPLIRNPFLFMDFSRWYTAELEEIRYYLPGNGAALTLLPLLAWTNRAINSSDPEEAFFYSKKLAKTLLSLYNSTQ